jgi:uncharacterized membrane protein YozB (DUF420 family)
MGFLGTTAGIPADINLVLQIAILCSLLIGRSRARKKNFRQHGKIMTVAVALNTASLATIMLPSLLLGLGFIVTYPTNPLSIIAILHAGLGTVSLILGFNLVLKWRLNKPLVECLKNRRFMKPTIILWATTATIGILLYIELYILTKPG